MYDQLGDGEPLTSKEADVVIKNIKSEKGYLSHGLQQDLQSLQERTQHYLQQTSDLQRQREAIYIKA
jgi:hypothetical protein